MIGTESGDLREEPRDGTVVTVSAPLSLRISTRRAGADSRALRPQAALEIVLDDLWDRDGAAEDHYRLR